VQGRRAREQSPFKCCVDKVNNMDSNSKFETRVVEVVVRRVLRVRAPDGVSAILASTSDFHTLHPPYSGVYSTVPCH
jgi:hypothetical protein